MRENYSEPPAIKLENVAVEVLEKQLRCWWSPRVMDTAISDKEREIIVEAMSDERNVKR